MEKSADLRALHDGRDGGYRPRVKVSREEFLEAWKKAADECVEGIFVSLPIDGPAVSGELKEAAIDAVMRLVWVRIDAPKGALWANRDAVRAYASDLVDKAVAKSWERATSRRHRLESDSRGISAAPSSE